MDITGKAVLLVDPNEPVCQHIQTNLTHLGHTLVGWAKTGHEALKLMPTLWPDMVILDLALPDMNGLALTQQIYELWARPIVIVTSQDDPALVADAAQMGAGAYLVKPVTAAELNRAMIVANARFMESSALQMENEKLSSDNARLISANEILQTAMGRHKMPNNFLVACSHCRRVRTENDKWMGLTDYLRLYAEVKFSHGICMDCLSLFYEEMLTDDDDDDDTDLSADNQVLLG